MSLLIDRRQQLFILLFILMTLQGCTQFTAQAISASKPPEITTDYLLEHRIITHDSRYQETIISTLPYEIKTFDEEYRLYLIARIPDENSTILLRSNQPHYYLWLERRADNWRDFIGVRSIVLSPLTVNSYYSSIRQGRYYKEYTIDLTLEDIHTVEGSGLELLLYNSAGIMSSVTLPSLYLKAFLAMLKDYDLSQE